MNKFFDKTPLKLSLLLLIFQLAHNIFALDIDEALELMHQWQEDHTNLVAKLVVQSSGIAESESTFFRYVETNGVNWAMDSQSSFPAKYKVIYFSDHETNILAYFPATQDLVIAVPKSKIQSSINNCLSLNIDPQINFDSLKKIASNITAKPNGNGGGEVWTKVDLNKLGAIEPTAKTLHHLYLTIGYDASGKIEVIKQEVGITATQSKLVEIKHEYISFDKDSITNSFPQLPELNKLNINKSFPEALAEAIAKEQNKI